MIYLQPLFLVWYIYQSWEMGTLWVHMSTLKSSYNYKKPFGLTIVGSIYHEILFKLRKHNKILYCVNYILYRNLFTKTIWKIPYWNTVHLENASLYVISINKVKPQNYYLKFQEEIKLCMIFFLSRFMTKSLCCIL